MQSQSSQVFSVRGFEALFPHTGTPVAQSVLLPNCSLSLLVYLNTNVGPPTLPAAASPGLPAATLPQVLSAQRPISTPPTSLDECFCFNSLVVRLPYS